MRLPRTVGAGPTAHPASCMRLTRFARFALVVLAYTFFVVAWGAFVRATGSGAGCGRHWPTCNGVVVPREASVATLIEFGHRATSGLALLLVVALGVWAVRALPRQHPARRAALVSVFFILTEAAIGAGLVLFEYVANDARLARAVWLGAHLVNTFLLIGAIALTAWFGAGAPRLRLRGQGGVGLLLAGGLVAMLGLGVTGAITALGDTLFPAASLAEGLRQDQLATSHLLLRLRVWHPTLAVITGVYLAIVALVTIARRRTVRTRRLALAIVALFVAQLGVGLVNLALLAPVWLQLVHLLMADVVWIVLVLLTASAVADDAREGATVSSVHGSTTRAA